MNTASPIAQFMALLSGSVRPELLKQVPNNGQNAIKDFQSLIEIYRSSPQSTLTVDSVLNLNIDPSATSDDVVQTSGLWRLIQQQSNVNGQNAVVVNLSEKGLPDDVIQELTNLFSTSDLITILKDPDLNAQFDQLLTETNLEEGSTDLITSLQALLIQDVDNVENLTFKKSELVEDNVVDILTGFTQNNIATSRQSANSAALNDPLLSSQAGLNLVAANKATHKERPVTTDLDSKSYSFGFGTKAGEANSQENQTHLLAAAHRRSDHSLQSSYQSIADRLASVSKTVDNSVANASNLAIEEFNMITVGADGQLFLSEGDLLIPMEAGFKTASSASHHLLHQPMASQPHPTTQMVAMTLTKIVHGKDAGQGNHTYRLQLDPPEMGRLDIEMDFLDGGRIKAVITADKPESIGLLQRDMHVLVKAMQDAGFDGMSNNDFSFNLNQNGQDSSPENRHSNKVAGHGDQKNSDDLEITETEMSVIIDPITGQQSVNMLV